MAKNELLPGTVYRMCVHGAYIAGSYAKKLIGSVLYFWHVKGITMLTCIRGEH
jgi:hypothetical protein